MRSSTALFALISVIVGVILFRVKYEVDHLAYEHKIISKNIRNTEETIHLLKAEWAHLNDPARIHKLAVKYLPDQNKQSSTAVPTVHKKEVPLQETKKNIAVTDVSFQEHDAFDILLEEEDLKPQSVRHIRYQKGGS
ncbi:MAG: hypothetical protein COY39_03525 [Alphaproteobacteria bacterium CG_4_10_14_0_8_um_filter_37_21]|nr:MAG: hypothetical protein COY39_03525 [Alphaproteobacteria bacterium CG_4_10_14_0_8_um_filter_37_21]